MFGSQQNKFGFGGSSFGQTTTGFGQQPQTSVFGSSFGTTQTPSTGSMFGQSTSAFGQPAQQPAQNSSFFGGTPGTSSSIFGQTQPQQTTTNAFGSSTFGNQPRPSFGGFGATTTSTQSSGLFGQQNTASTSGLFGSTQSSVFGSSAFGSSSAPVGTTVPFKVVTGTDTMMKNGATQNIQTQHQCITCMKEYETKSLEELRVEDYLANRKQGNQAQQTTSTFGAPSTSTSSTGSIFGQNTSTQSSGFAFGATTNNQAKPNLFASGFGSTTTQPTAFGQPTSSLSFGSATTSTPSVFGQPAPATSTAFGTGFGAAAQPKPAFGFGAPTTVTTTQAATNAFGATSTASPFGSTLANNQPKPTVGFGSTGFGASSFGQPRFGTASTAFSAPTATSSNFSFGTNTATQGGGMFPKSTLGTFSFNTPATGSTGFGTTTSTTSTQPFGGFGTSTLGSGAFGSTTGGLFNNSATTAFGPQATNPQDDIARNRQLIMMTSLPLGGDSFFKCEVKKDTVRPTSLAAQKAIIERTFKPNTPPAPKSKVIPVNRTLSNPSLFAGLDDGETTHLGQSPKTITFKPKVPEGYSSPSIYQPTVLRNTSIEEDKSPEKTANVTVGEQPDSGRINPPRHSTPYHPSTRSPEAPSPSRTEGMTAIQEEETTLNLGNSGNKSILKSSDTEVNKENENQVGVILQRTGYYTVPPLKSLRLDGSGDCFVTDFIVGRKGYGSVKFLGRMNVKNLDLDSTVIFRRKEITVYPDEDQKPPVGQGLNRKAEVTLEEVYPINKLAGELVTDPQRLIAMKFRETLERYSTKMSASFLDYEELTGTWVFRVNHFSRYGLLDDDGDEDDVLMTETRPLQSVIPPLEAATAKLKERFANPMEFTQMEPSGEHVFSPASFQVCNAMKLDNSVLQGMKASLFMDECEEEYGMWNQPNGTSKPSYFIGVEPPVVEEKKLRMSPPHERVQTILRPKKQIKLSLQATEEFLNRFDKIPTIRVEVDPLEQTRVIHAAARFQRIVVPDECSIFTKFGNVFVNELSSFNRTRVRPSFYNWTVARPSTKTEQRSLNITLPGHSQGVSSVSLERIQFVSSSSDLTEMMSVQIANSDVKTKVNVMPLYCPKKGVALMQNHIKRLENHEDLLNVELSNALTLCDALWGDGISDSLDSIETEAARKRNLSAWITRVTAGVIAQEVGSAESPLHSMMSYLSGHQILAACEEAIAQSDYHLATLISQASHDQTTKMIVKNLYAEWTDSKKDQHIHPERLKIYALMAGIPQWSLSSGQNINVFSNLDWLRCFAIHLWYMCPSNMSIADVMAEYVEATESYATAPTVKHGDVQTIAPEHLCFQLIKLYTDHSQSVNKMLCPDTILSVQSQLEYRHCWLLAQVLHSLGYAVPCMEEMHVRMASQLESQGLWQWAAFPLLHIENSKKRWKAVYDLLCRHACPSIGMTEAEDFVHTKLQVPKIVVYKAKALRAGFEELRFHQTELLVLAEEYSEAHEILVTYLAVKAVINDKHAILGNLLCKLNSHEDKIQTWSQRGRVFYIYTQLRFFLQDIIDNRNDPEAYDQLIHSSKLDNLLASLAPKLFRLPKESVEQRLCQIEMSKTTFTAYKNILLTRTVKNPSLKNSAVKTVYQLLTKLPLPEDTVAHEFKRLSEEYPEYLQ